MSDTVWVRSDDWVGTEVDGSYVMVNVETGKYISLNETAAAIWQALDTPQTDAQIGAYLSERFEISADDCTAAVADTLATMREMSLISA
ncbi:PqqD family protein [Sphingomonas bacterium]|uniref:PqqD family protein n=1 Tax=Sphingomonas bacterium TaxID=1895847 RepID=UPI0026154E82|nr:PqqD family protein [Sphingomonas bacterium]MDB5678814.1 PqqD family protein [Sphingomonas bacterium]